MHERNQNSRWNIVQS